MFGWLAHLYATPLFTDWIRHCKQTSPVLKYQAAYRLGYSWLFSALVKIIIYYIIFYIVNSLFDKNTLSFPLRPVDVSF